MLRLLGRFPIAVLLTIGSALFIVPGVLLALAPWVARCPHEFKDPWSSYYYSPLVASVAQSSGEIWASWPRLILTAAACLFGLFMLVFSILNETRRARRKRAVEVHF